MRQHTEICSCVYTSGKGRVIHLGDATQVAPDKLQILGQRGARRGWGGHGENARRCWRADSVTCSRVRCDGATYGEKCGSQTRHCSKLWLGLRENSLENLACTRLSRFGRIALYINDSRSIIFRRTSSSMNQFECVKERVLPARLFDSNNCLKSVRPTVGVESRLLPLTVYAHILYYHTHAHKEARCARAHAASCVFTVQ